MASITSYYQNKTQSTPSVSNGNVPITPTPKVTGNGITSYYKTATTQNKTVPTKVAPVQDFKTTNATRNIYSPVTPILQQATISQAPKEKEKNIWQKATGFIDRIFNGSEEEQTVQKNVESQVAYNVQKVAGQELVEKRVKELAVQNKITYEESKKLTEGLARESGKSVYDVVGLSLDQLAKPGGNPWKNSLFENLSVELGTRGTPTNAGFIEGSMTLALGLGVVQAPLVALKGIGLFGAVISPCPGLRYRHSGSM